MRNHQKKGIFRFQSQFLRLNVNLSSWNQFSHLNIELGEQLSLKALIFSTNLIKLYLVKMCLIFAGWSSSCLKRYKQILSGCSFVTKKLLNFAWLPMKFHNHGHINIKHSLLYWILDTLRDFEIHPFSLHKMGVFQSLWV